MYDTSFEEWIECEEFYNDCMTDDEFIEWCEEVNYASFEEMCELYDSLGE